MVRARLHRMNRVFSSEESADTVSASNFKNPLRRFFSFQERSCAWFGVPAPLLPKVAESSWQFHARWFRRRSRGGVRLQCEEQFSDRYEPKKPCVEKVDEWGLLAS